MRTRPLVPAWATVFHCHILAPRGQRHDGHHWHHQRRSAIQGDATTSTRCIAKRRASTWVTC